MKRSAFIWLVLTFSAAAAFAQQAPPGPTTGQTGDPRKDARVHIGPFHVTPALVVNNLGVDTNVFNAEGEQKSDFTASIVPKMTMWSGISNRMLITTTLATGMTYYKTYFDQSSLDPSLSVRAELTLRRLTLFGTQAYTQSRQRPNDEIDVRVPQTLSGTTIGFSFKLGARLKFDASAQRNHTSYDNNADFLGVSLRQRLNRFQQGVQVQLERRLTSLTSVRILAENRQDRFELSPNRDASGLRVAAGATMGRRALVSGDGEVGVRTMKHVNTSLSPFGGVVAKVALTHQRQGATQVRLEWNRDIEFSYEAVHTYYLQNSLRLTLRRQLAGRFDALVAGGKNVSSYAKVVALPEAPSTIVRLLTCDIGYRLTRDTRLGFAITRTWRTSDPPSGRDYSGIKAGISFSVGS